MESIVIGLFGGGAVGKSSITLRYISGEFNEGYVPTVIDEWSNIINLKQSNKKAELQFIDTSGQEEFETLKQNAYPRCDCVIIVIDVTNQTSVEEAKTVYKEAYAVCNKDVLFVVAINKYDLFQGTKKDCVNILSDSKQWANEIGCKCFETSAKANINIQEMVDFISNEVHDIKQKKKCVKKEAEGGCCLIY